MRPLVLGHFYFRLTAFDEKASGFLGDAKKTGRTGPAS